MNWGKRCCLSCNRIGKGGIYFCPAFVGGCFFWSKLLEAVTEFKCMKEIFGCVIVREL